MVDSFDGEKHHVLYDDGDRDSYVLADITYRLLTGGDGDGGPGTPTLGRTPIHFPAGSTANLDATRRAAERALEGDGASKPPAELAGFAEEGESSSTGSSDSSGSDAEGEGADLLAGARGAGPGDGEGDSLASSDRGAYHLSGPGRRGSSSSRDTMSSEEGGRTPGVGSKPSDTPTPHGRRPPERPRPATSFEARPLDRSTSFAPATSSREAPGGIRRTYTDAPGSWAATARPISAPEQHNAVGGGGSSSDSDSDRIGLAEKLPASASSTSTPSNTAGASPTASPNGTGAAVGTSRTGSTSRGGLSGFGDRHAAALSGNDSRATPLTRSATFRAPSSSVSSRRPPMTRMATESRLLNGSTRAAGKLEPLDSSLQARLDSAARASPLSAGAGAAESVRTPSSARSGGTAGPASSLASRRAISSAAAARGAVDEFGSARYTEDAARVEAQAAAALPRTDSWLKGEEKLFDPGVPLDDPPAPPELEVMRELEQEVAREEIPDYESMLAEAARPEEIVVATVSAEEAERRERDLEKARLEAARTEAKAFHERELALLRAEENARRRVVQAEKQARARVLRREAQSAARAAEREQALHRVFERAEAHLKDVFRAQQATVTERFGTLEPGRAGARKLRVQWDRLPQPLEIHVHRVRAVKDKAPKGNYVLLATPYDRLGGEPLQWSKLARGGGLEEDQWPATHPRYHHGRYYDTDLVINDSLFAVAPAPTDIHPSNVFILELFLLGTARNPVDRVVAWGALPMCDPDFQAVRGTFQLPLLAGEVDLNIDKYAAMEATYARDLGTWLANVYLEVKHMPRSYVDEGGTRRGEFDVELAFTSEMLRLPSDVRDREHLEDDGAATSSDEEGDIGDGRSVGAAERKAGGRMADAHGYSGAPGAATSGLRQRRHRKGASSVGGASATHGAFLDGSDLGFAAGGGGGGERARLLGNVGGGSRRSLDGSMGLPSVLGGDGSGSLTSRGTGLIGSQRRPLVATGSLRDMRTIGLSGASPGLSQDGEPIRTQQSVWRGGATRDRSNGHRRGDTRVAAAGGGRQRAGSGAGGAATTAPAVDFAHLSNKASYAVSRMDSRALQRHRMSERARKMRYLQHELISDLRPSQFSSGEFGVQVGVLLVALWLRIYVHYMGQWLFLRFLRVPVYDFRPLPLRMVVKYVSSVLPTETEIGVTIMGQMTNIVFLIAMVGVAYASARVLGHFPEISSRFIAFYGLGTCLDAVLVMVVDVMSGNFNCGADSSCADVASPLCTCTEGDAFRLYFRFEADEGSGIVGGFLTAFLFAAMFMLSAFVLYLFLLHVHLDGRMLDVYRRLNGTESAFFVPHDFEISPEELQWIVTKSRRWRGAKGMHKRIAVCTYKLTDPLDPAFAEVTTHLVIYKAVSSGGSREMHRHFERLPDGAILEIFGSFDRHFGSQFKELETLLMAHGKESEEAVDQFFDGLQFGRMYSSS